MDAEGPGTSAPRIRPCSECARQERPAVAPIAAGSGGESLRGTRRAWALAINQRVRRQSLSQYNAVTATRVRHARRRQWGDLTPGHRADLARQSPHQFSGASETAGRDCRADSRLQGRLTSKAHALAAAADIRQRTLDAPQIWRVATHGAAQAAGPQLRPSRAGGDAPSASSQEAVLSWATLRGVASATARQAQHQPLTNSSDHSSRHPSSGVHKAAGERCCIKRQTQRLGVILHMPDQRHCIRCLCFTYRQALEAARQRHSDPVRDIGSLHSTLFNEHLAAACWGLQQAKFRRLATDQRTSSSIIRGVEIMVRGWSRIAAGKSRRESPEEEFNLGGSSARHVPGQVRIGRQLRNDIVF